MHLLFPESPLNHRTPDDLVREQFDAFQRAGYSASLFSIESLQAGTLKFSFSPCEPAEFLYRGWMLSAPEYRLLCDSVASRGFRMCISSEQYLAAHHLPNWYRHVRDFTPETIVLDLEEATPERLADLGWHEFFIKDFVKSLKTSIGSRITDPKQLPALLLEMRHFRGDIEGGVCLRRVEHFEAASEVRYFVIHGVPFGPKEGSPVPDIAAQAASRIPSPFFSIDVARRRDGTLRIVEVGDGQVSDLVGWTPERFVEIWKQTPNKALEPTPPSVTSPAGAGAAPAGVVAHL